VFVLTEAVRAYSEHSKFQPLMRVCRSYITLQMLLLMFVM